MGNKISIAIATYNGERFLRQQLNSLYAQTRLPDEIIVCDDCSKDSTPDILEEYHKKYGLKYYVNDTALGVNGNFFKALSLCFGDYICICDQDDIWFSNKIETLYNAIIKYDNTFPNCVSSQRIDIDAQGNQIGKQKILSDTEGWQATLMTTGRSQGCTMIINRSLRDRAIQIYHSFNSADNMMYDVLIAFIAAIEGNKLNLGEQLMLYRHHENNVVDKFHEKKLTFAQKTTARPTYYPFLSDERIANLAIMNTLYRNWENKKDILCFLKKMDALSHCDSTFKGIKIILTLDIPLMQKIKVCIFTPINNLLKLLV